MTADAATDAPASPREVLTISQAAGLLQVSVSTVKRLIREGSIPCRRVGSRVRFSRAALLDWLGGDLGAVGHRRRPKRPAWLDAL